MSSSAPAANNSSSSARFFFFCGISRLSFHSLSLEVVLRCELSTHGYNIYGSQETSNLGFTSGSPPFFCCFILKIKRESFTSDVPVADGSLVSVPPPSSQLDSKDKLWRLHSALLQCYVLLERAIAKEEEELGGSKRLDDETQRKMVKERLSLLIINTRELLKAVDGTVQTPSVAELEVSIHWIECEGVGWPSALKSFFLILSTVSCSDCSVWA